MAVLRSSRARDARWFLAFALAMGCAGSSIVGGPDATTDLGSRADAVVGDAASGDVTPADAGTAFDPRVHGFSFANYDNTSMPANLGAAEMVRLFGRGVCEQPTGDACTLTPVANGWMNDINRRMAIGHCEGMAVLSVLMQRGVVSPSRFQAGATSASALPRNTALERELALWWATQELPGLTMEACPTGAEALRMLEDAARTPGAESFTLGMWTRENGALVGGHAVTPIGVERDGTAASLLLYDNNFPGETRRLRYTNVATGAWTYRTSQNPAAARADYTGDDAQNRLCLYALRPRLTLPTTCRFCGNYAPMAGPATPPLNPMMLPMPTPRGGTRTGGASGGAVVRVANGSGPLPPPSAERGINPGDQIVSPLYSLPEGEALRVTVAAPAGVESATTDFYVHGEGYRIGVEGMVLQRDESDTLTLPESGAGIFYQTTRAESATVAVAVTFNGADWRFEVRTRGEAVEQQIWATLDPRDGTLMFSFPGTSGMNSFDLFVERVEGDQTLSFQHMGNIEPDGAILSLHYANWTHDADPMPLDVDVNGDGDLTDMGEGTSMLSDMP